MLSAVSNNAVGSMMYAALGSLRWTAKRKEELIKAVYGGLISKEDALREHQISEEEFTYWLVCYDAGGRRRLNVTAMVRRRRPSQLGSGE